MTIERLFALIHHELTIMTIRKENIDNLINSETEHLMKHGGEFSEEAYYAHHNFIVTLKGQSEELNECISALEYIVNEYLNNEYLNEVEE